MSRMSLAIAAWALASACGGNSFGHLHADRTGDMSAGPVPRADYRADLIAACGKETSLPRGAAVFDRYPYFTRLASDGVELRWTTRSPDPAILEITLPDGSLVGSATLVPETDPDTSLPILRSARISGLAPDTLYCYAIRDASGPLLGRTGFRTAPAPGTLVSGELRFIALGDMGFRSDDQTAVYHWMRRVAVDAVVLTGDIAYESGTTNELDDNFFAVYREMLGHVPFLPASGNHDQGTRKGKALLDAFDLPRGYHARDIGPVHFVLLDSVDITVEERRWLEADLAANRLPWVVVALHHPPYSSGQHGDDERVQELLEPIFRAHQVALVLCGHDHDYERTRPISGVTYVVTGGGGRGTRPVGRSWFTAFAAQVAHFVHVTVTADRLVVRAVDATGQTFDTTVIDRPKAVESL